jgi:hypothetical protein
MIARCHYFIELIELLNALWRGVHLADELSESGIQSVVHVSQDDCEIGQNIAIKMALMCLAAFCFLNEVTHHGVALLYRVLTVTQVAGDEVEMMVLEYKVELDASLVAHHPKETIAVCSNFRLTYVVDVLLLRKNKQHNLPH